MKIPYKLVKAATLERLKAEYQQLLQSNKAATAFIKEIENGNLQARFSGGAEESEEGLSQALQSMQRQLQKIAEEEKERNWATHGLAMFAEILRTNSSSAAAFYQKIISTLVTYLDANQGGLFLIEEHGAGQVSIELASCYAYNRQKYLKKSLTPGEGLIGQCYLEKDTIYLTDIPQSYVNITSGLGTANPRCLVIVPLKVNEEVHGFVELASFQDIRRHQVEFLEKLGESIASTISAVKVSEKTQRLLHDSQQQAEELRAAEEEMRQNMEELHATQENQSRLQKELIANEAELKKQLQALQDARAEIEQVRQIEQERANERIENQKRATEKLVLKFKENEKQLRAEVEKLKLELSTIQINNLQET